MNDETAVPSGFQKAVLAALDGEFGQAFRNIYQMRNGKQLTHTFTPPDILQFGYSDNSYIDRFDDAYLEGVIDAFAILHALQNNDARILERYGLKAKPENDWLCGIVC